MITYSYTISSTGPTTSVQSAINQIVNQLKTDTNVERDIEVLIDKGTYSGFTIPDASLYPLYVSGYNLIIKSSGNYFPIIDFNKSRPEQIVGIDIGSGNPNVIIDRLRIQYFALGVRAGLNSHYPIVKNCIVNNNRNVGIFFEQVKQAQAIQNVVTNGDYGIVCRLVKSAALLHNTIFMNGAISNNPGKSISCIWAELANDYGNGTADSGVLHLLGNIGWNTSGRCLTVFLSDVEAPDKFISNFNNWVVGDPNEFIVVEDNAFYKGANSSPRRIFKNLIEWKATNNDLESKSEDPKFISPLKIKRDRNGYAIDLNLLPVSPVLGMVPSFAYDGAESLEWLPTYVDSSDLSKDILKFNRNQSGTAAGANDKLSTAGFFGQDVFSNPLDLDITKKCGVDPFSNILYKAIDLWYPKLEIGYFYSNEREFYLYSKKETKTIGELASTKFFLPASLAHNKPIVVKACGKKIDSSYYDVCLNLFTLHHKDLDIVTKEEEVEIEGMVYNWNGSSFFYNKVLYRFKINEGTTKYYLPSNYYNRGPVVVTDDMSFPTDSDIISNREYCLKFDSLENRSELIFANSVNQIVNGQFDYKDGDEKPLFWQSSNAVVTTGAPPFYSVAGSSVCTLYDEGYIKKLVALTENENHCFSFHSMSQGSGTINWEIEYYSSNYDTLGVIETGSISSTNTWSRYHLSFIPKEITTGFIPQLPYPTQKIQNYVPPKNCAYVSLKIGHSENPAYTGTLLVDAVQYEHSSFPTLYHRAPFLNELTVEYETKVDNYFTDTRMTISPIVNLVSDGFIYIPEIPASSYNGPQSPAITTLHEWRWPEGRKKLIPWARTKGKDKLRKRPYGKFNYIPDPKPEIISPVSFSATVKDIELYPSVPTTFIGDNNGIGVSVKVVDNFNNPHALNSVTLNISDYNLKYPGTLSKKVYGLKEQLGPVIAAKTDNSGTMTFTWIPPNSPAGVYSGPVPSSSMISINGDRIGLVITEYPISLDSLGNITIFDSKGVNILTHATVPNISNYVPTYSSDSSIIKLKYPIYPGSVKILVGNTYYYEAQSNILESNQFFIDYENLIITIKGKVPVVNVEYIPSYYYISQVDPYKIMLYIDKIFDSSHNFISIGYDISIKLKATVSDPARQSVFSKEFELIAQNPLSNNKAFLNTLSLEF